MQNTPTWWMKASKRSQLYKRRFTASIPEASMCCRLKKIVLRSLRTDTLLAGSLTHAFSVFPCSVVDNGEHRGIRSSTSVSRSSAALIFRNFQPFRTVVPVACAHSLCYWVQGNVHIQTNQSLAAWWPRHRITRHLRDAPMPESTIKRIFIRFADHGGDREGSVEAPSVFFKSSPSARPTRIIGVCIARCPGCGYGHRLTKVSHLVAGYFSSSDPYIVPILRFRDLFFYLMSCQH